MCNAWEGELTTWLGRARALDVLHVWTDYAPPDPQEARRFEVARQSWTALDWTEAPVRDAECPRHWHERGKRLPFLVDVVDHAARMANAPSTILVLTNRDSIVRGDALARIGEKLATFDACYSRRRNVLGLRHPVPDAYFDKGTEDGGTDLFAFRASWWDKHRDELDGFLVGVDTWDSVARLLIDGLSNRAHVPGLVLHDHRTGDRPWWRVSLSRPGARPYAHRLAWETFERHGVDPRKEWIRYPLIPTDPTWFVVPNLTPSRP